MTPDQAVAAIKRGLGFKTTLDTTIITALQEAQNDLENEAFLPKFLIQQKSLVTAADTETINFPTGFIREDEDDSMVYLQDDYATVGPTPLHKDSAIFNRTAYPGTGEPAAYSVDKGVGKFRIFPLPDDIYNLRSSCYIKDTVLAAAGAANQWLTYAHKVMIGVAGRKMAEGLRDKDAIALFQKIEAEGRATLVTGQEATEHENQRYAMGGDD